jgi:hypothetical protein
MRSGTGTTCEEERRTVNSKYPSGWYLYAGLAVLSSILVATGLHREVYALLRTSGIPSPGISVIAGLAGLSWYEIAYTVGGGLKMVRVYDALPFLGCLTGILSGVLLLTDIRLRREALLVHLGISTALSLLALGVLLWRLVRGIPDTWRILTVLAFLVASTGWIFYFRRTREHFRRRHGRPTT